ncbi:MAG: TonB-dependent receptor [Steroidobacteraceae bacterium]
MAQQASTPLLVSFDLVKSRKANSLEGEFTLKEGLRKLLESTGLVANIDAMGVIVVSALPEAKEPSQSEGIVENFRKKSLFGSVSTFILSAFGISANAQQAPLTAGALEEVVVTARYTAENAQQTSLAITAITSEQLESRGYEQVADVAASVPNVSFLPSGGNFGKAITALVRGVGQTDNSFAFNPGVGFYFDDVYMGSLTGANLALVDIDSVEILRGPQGTLFGANTESGAVRINTVKPKGDNSGHASIGYGSFHHIKVTGGFDIPLIDNKLFLRASGISDKQDGYQKLYDFPCLYPSLSGSLPQQVPGNVGCQRGTLGDTDVVAARVALRWLATDSLEVNLTGDVSNDTSNIAATTLIAINPSRNQNLNDTVFEPMFGVRYDSRFIPSNPYVSYQTNSDPVTNQQFGLNSPLFSYGLSGKVDWDVAENVHVKSITGYRSDSNFAPYGTGQSPLGGVASAQNFIRDQFSEEINFTGKALSGKLDWAAGGFYYRSAGTTLGDIDLMVFGVHFLTYNKARDENKSVFVHGNYHFTDQLSLEVGLRHTDSLKTFTIGQTGVNPPQAGFPAFTVDYSAKRVDPKIGVQYQWTPDFMTYAVYSTGFKGGGSNPYAVSGLSAVTPFGPEFVKSYEIGAKSEWLNHHLRANAALFRMDYKDLQLQVRDDLGNPFEENVGSAKVQGIELEIEARTTAGFAVNAAGSYLHYKTVDCGIACVSRGGSIPDDGVAPYAPKYKFNVGAEYTINLGNDAGTLTPRVDYTYQSSIFTDISNDPEYSYQKAYGVANAHLMWNAGSDNWSGQVAISNLFNKFYYLNTYNNYYSAGSVSGTPSRPREVMFTLKRKF